MAGADSARNGCFGMATGGAAPGSAGRLVVPAARMTRPDRWWFPSAEDRLARVSCAYSLCGMTLLEDVWEAAYDPRRPVFDFGPRRGARAEIALFQVDELRELTKGTVLR